MCLEHLKERYQNKRIIIHNHLRELSDIPPIKRESYVALQKLLDSLQKHTRALASLGQKADRWDTMLVYLLTTKLDCITKREFEEVTQKKRIIPQLRI